MISYKLTFKFFQHEEIIVDVVFEKLATMINAFFFFLVVSSCWLFLKCLYFVFIYLVINSSSLSYLWTHWPFGKGVLVFQQLGKILNHHPSNIAFFPLLWLLPSETLTYVDIPTLSSLRFHSCFLSLDLFGLYNFFSYTFQFHS